MAIKGINLRMVVINCRYPAVFIRRVFTQVRIQMALRPVKTATHAFLDRIGKKLLMDPTRDTVMAALDDQQEIQYPHATRNPAKSPKPLRV
jgi:hypothetical protein